MPYKDDMTNESNKWMPEPGEYDVEIVKMEEGTSKQGNPKFTIHFASAEDAALGLVQDLTNIPGKRWLLRQLLEAVGIEPEENTEGKKIYNWDIPDVEGKTVTAKIEHEKSTFINRNNQEQESTKAKIVGFKKLST
jgi:hypothetical protein